jgi:PKD repeat protein
MDKNIVPLSKVELPSVNNNLATLNKVDDASGTLVVGGQYNWAINATSGFTVKVTPTAIGNLIIKGSVACGDGSSVSGNYCSIEVVDPPQICSNECTAGEKKCNGNGVQTCGDYDSDTCTEWGTVANCAANQTCASGFCTASTDLCSNKLKDPGEADIDCGGVCSTKCGDGKICGIDGDCQSGKCENGVCTSFKCTLNLIRRDKYFDQILEDDLDNVSLGKIFDIKITTNGNSDNIKTVNFINDEKQDNLVDPGFEWTGELNWNQDNVWNQWRWNSIKKRMEWSFSTVGEKEIVVELTDFLGKKTKCYAIINSYQYSPYPYGYSFPVQKMEGLSVGDKYDIFREAYNLNGVDSNTAYNFWKELLEKDSAFGEKGNCYGMSASSLMEYAYHDYDQFLENEAGKEDLYGIQSGITDWNVNGNDIKPIVKHVTKFQIAQYASAEQGTYGIEKSLEILKNSLPKTEYLLNIHNVGIYPPPIGHELVPYSLKTITEGKSYELSVYDPNYPADGNRILSIMKNNNDWLWLYDMGNDFEHEWWSGKETFGISVGTGTFLITPIADLYSENGKFTIPGTNGQNDSAIFLKGEADIVLTDNNGLLTGFKNNDIIENIPGAIVKIPSGVYPVEGKTDVFPWIYLPQDKDLKYTIYGKELMSAEYKLSKFGPNYHLEYAASSKEGEENDLFVSKNGKHITISGQGGDYHLILNRNNDGQSQTFEAINIFSNTSAVFEYTINWDKLVNNEKGVQVKIDQNGDGMFEKTYYSGSTFTMPIEAPTSSAGGPYAGNEGENFVLDASGSTAGSGEIVKYEWDLDYDGVYETEAATSTMEYVWKDDFEGKIGLQITQDNGLNATSTDDLLTATSTADVMINNVAPAVEAGADQIITDGSEVKFIGSFNDPGTLDTHEIKWDFGDGTGAEGTLTPVHKYAGKGNYTARLTVADDDGGIGSDTVNIFIGDKPDTGDDEPVPDIVPVSPSAAPASGTYNSAQNIVLSALGSTSIRYTIDGTGPTCSKGLVYSKPIAVSKNKTIKAVSCYEGGVSSDAVSFTYNIKRSSGGGTGSIVMVPQVLGASTEELSLEELQKQFNDLLLKVSDLVTAAQAKGIRISPALLATLNTVRVSARVLPPNRIYGEWRLGDRNEEVKLAQTALAKDSEIYPQGLITGYFGPLTKAAVIRFQNKDGLPLTGITDAATREKLNAILSK